MNRKVISKHFALFLVFIVFFVLPIKAIKTDTILNGVTFEAKMLYGSIFPHSSSVAYLLDKNLYGFEVSLSTESRGRMLWEQLYRYPRYGVAYSYLNLGNPEDLGSVHNLFGYIEIPFSKKDKNISFTYQIDAGLSYFTKTYNAYKNSINHIVSSPITVHLGLDFSSRIKLGNKNELKTSLELAHSSNGKTRVPNLGLNTINLSAAWLYSIKPSSTVVNKFEESGYKKHFVEFLYNVGGKRDENYQETVYLISSIIAEYNYAYSPKYAVGGGLDLFYDGAVAQYYEYKEEKEASKMVNYQMGMHVGFRARYGKMHILLNVGRYFAAEYLRSTTVYSRIGLRYNLTENILLNLTLKAHTTVADYIEWGVGYRLNTKGR